MKKKEEEAIRAALDLPVFHPRLTKLVRKMGVQKKRKGGKKMGCEEPESWEAGDGRVVTRED